jgi:hypothetical protein
VAKLTADEYRRQAPALRAAFGAKRYAVTSVESMRPDVLRKADVSAYLRRFEGSGAPSPPFVRRFARAVE